MEFRNATIYQILPNQITDEHIIKSCEFVCGATHEQLYMKFDKQYQQELSESADPWVILCLHKMLRAGGDFMSMAQLARL